MAFKQLNLKQGLIFSALYLCGLIAILFGFFIPTHETMNLWFRSCGLTIVSGTAVIWIYSLIQVLRRHSFAALIRTTKRHTLSVAIAIALTVGAFLVNAPGVRVLEDETNLLGTAMSIHGRQEIYHPMQAVFTAEGVAVEQKFYDKRPLVFPLSVAVVHSLTGYRFGNGLIVNFVCGVLALSLLQVCFRRWFGRNLAIVAAILLSAFPVYVRAVTSSGFEVLNLFLAVLSFALLDSFLTNKKIETFELLGLTLALLAQVRYESAVFPLCFGAVLLVSLRASEYRSLTWRTYALPFLFLPIPWQRLPTNNPGWHYLPEGEVPFSTEYFWPNLQAAWMYFSGAEPHYGGVPIALFAAIAGGVCATVILVRRFARNAVSRRLIALSVAATSALAALSAAILVHYWGDLTLPNEERYAVILLPFLVFFAICLIRIISIRVPCTVSVAAIGCVGLLIFHWPKSAHNDPFWNRPLQTEYRESMNFLKENYPDNDACKRRDKTGTLNGSL